MKPLKVWGGLVNRRGGQHRAIVAATTKKRALELLTEAQGTTWPYSKSHFDGFWSETRNKIELALAVSEGVWVSRKSLREGGFLVAEDFEPATKGTVA